LPSSVSIYVPDGAPLMALANIYQNTPRVQGVNINITRTTGPLIGGHLVAVRPDFALVPMNLAANRFNSDGEYILAGVALWGVLHIIENTNYSNGNPAVRLSDLIGETIVAYQRMASPGIILDTILRENGLEVNWLANINDAINPNAVNIISLLDNAAANQALLGYNLALAGTRFALLAEPVATIRDGENNFRRAFDLQEEWDNVFSDEENNFRARVSQVGVVVRASLARQHPSFVEGVLDLIAGSIDFARENPVITANLIVNDLISVYIGNNADGVSSFLSGTGQEVFNFERTNNDSTIDAIMHFLNILYEANPSFIGGSVPNRENFLMIPSVLAG